MVEKDGRVSLGQTVREIALHYYMGLTGQNEYNAEKSFATALASNNNLVGSALRMAEHEVLHG